VFYVQRDIVVRLYSIGYADSLIFYWKRAFYGVFNVASNIKLS